MTVDNRQRKTDIYKIRVTEVSYKASQPHSNYAHNFIQNVCSAAISSVQYQSDQDTYD